MFFAAFLANFSSASAVDPPSSSQNIVSSASLNLTSKTLVASTGTTRYLGAPINLSLTNIPSASVAQFSVSAKSYGGSSGKCASGGIAKGTRNFCAFNSPDNSPVAGIFFISITLNYLDANNNPQTLTPSLSYSVDDGGNISLVALNPSSNIIDKTPPNIALAPLSEQNDEKIILLVADAKDDITPDNQILYSWDNQESWTKQATFSATKNGIITVFAKDESGNISRSATFEIDSFSENPDKENQLETSSKNPAETSPPTENIFHENPNKNALQPQIISQKNNTFVKNSSLPAPPKTGVFFAKIPEFSRKNENLLKIIAAQTTIFLLAILVVIRGLKTAR